MTRTEFTDIKNKLTTSLISTVINDIVCQIFLSIIGVLMAMIITNEYDFASAGGIIIIVSGTLGSLKIYLTRSRYKKRVEKLEQMFTKGTNAPTAILELQMVPEEK